MISEFIDRNPIFVGIVIVPALVGTVLGLIGCTRERSAIGFGTTALLIALAILGAGLAQRQAYLNASVAVQNAYGLSRADRTRLVAWKDNDAGGAIALASALALVPLAAGSLSIF